MSEWPHAPMHAFNEKGLYMVTGATLYNELHFIRSEDLDHLQNSLFELSLRYQWRLEAWAIFANHYHFLAASENPQSLPKFITHFHASTARELNKINNSPGRKVWYQYWDSRITYHNSYMARLNYVMQNPVKHKLAAQAADYPWCSAAWFARHATKSYQDVVTSFKIDRVACIPDDFLE